HIKRSSRRAAPQHRTPASLSYESLLTGDHAYPWRARHLVSRLLLGAIRSGVRCCPLGIVDYAIFQLTNPDRCATFAIPWKIMRSVACLTDAAAAPVRCKTQPAKLKLSVTPCERRSSKLAGDEVENVGTSSMARRAGTADLPLHGGNVPKWLADRMTR